MNAEQRRKLKRIKERQADSAERNLGKLNQSDREFLKKHTAAPKNVCVMTEEQGRRFDNVGIGHRCTSTGHRHYTRKHVQELVMRGELVWLGQHHKIAAWTSDRAWAKVYTRNKFGEVINAGMQLISGARR